jgi:hypothetical protein
VLSAEIILEQDRGSSVEATTLYNDAVDGLARVLGLRIGHARDRAEGRRDGAHAGGRSRDHRQGAAR